jgi:hypothetical protein
MNRNPVMVDVIRDLFYFFSRNDVTLQDVSERVGSITHDPGGLMPIELNSTLPGVRAATLSRYPDSASPYMLDLTPAPNARPTAAELRNFLGDYHRALTDRGRPWELVFYPPRIEERCRVAVIAEVEPGAADLDSAPIMHVALRRDAVVAEPAVQKNDAS